MAETTRSMGERHVESILSAIPAMSSAMQRLQGRPSTDERAMRYIRSIWPDARTGEICSSLRDFVLAEEAETCHQNCPGVKRCPNKGFRPNALCEPYGEGGRVFVVRWPRCGFKAVQDSQTAAERALAGARLPERLKGCTMAAYRTAGLSPDIMKAKGMALAALADGNSLILAGSSGVGKTHLAAAIVNGRIEGGKPALFMSVPEFLDDLRKAISSGKGTDAMDAVKKSECLVLDDLGAERLTEWVAERLYMVVNHRYLHRLQTVITTNSANAVELVTRLGDQGERIVSRLVEMGTWCGIAAEDYRFMRMVDERQAGKAGRAGKSAIQPVMADIPF